MIPAGQRCERVISALDVTATMLDALDAPALPGSPGRSFLGLVSDARPTPDWEDVAFSEYVADQYTPDGESYHRLVRLGPWKLTYYEGMEPQLFNLAKTLARWWIGQLTRRANRFVPSLPPEYWPTGRPR